jgi:hypothetical protein
MKPFNNQFATQRLREEDMSDLTSSNQALFTIDDGQLYTDVMNTYGANIKYNGDYLQTDETTFQRILDLARSGEQDKTSEIRKKMDEEGSTTGGGEAYLPVLDVPEKKYKGPERGTGKGFIFKDLWEELNENYSKFRNETRTKTNEQQFHAAVRLAEKKIREANRILEYTAQLKSELSVIKENKNTQKLMERITRGIAEAYRKMKKLKP